MKCKECKNKIEGKSWLYCPYCGTEIEENNPPKNTNFIEVDIKKFEEWINSLDTIRESITLISDSMEIEYEKCI